MIDFFNGKEAALVAAFFVKVETQQMEVALNLPHKKNLAKTDEAFFVIPLGLEPRTPTLKV